MDSVFGNRGVYPFKRAESAEIHFVNTLVAKACIIIFMPLFYLYGIIEAGHVESWEAIKDGIFQKSRESYSKEFAIRDDSSWSKLLELLD